ncbi:glycoside hydrolase family 76 protein [Streptomyces sp. M19]
MAEQLVELGGDPHHADRLRHEHRHARLRLGHLPHLRAEQGRLRGGRAQHRPDRGRLHQPRHRRRGLVGVAWTTAYDYTHEQRYLDEAVIIADYVHGFWDTGTCGGGVWWDRERTYKNAVTSGLYLTLATALHQRVAGDTQWGDRARAAGDWFLSSGLIDDAGLVNDGLTKDCANNGQTVWSYNQGLAIGGLTELWRATGEDRLLESARKLADAALSAPN